MTLKRVLVAGHSHRGALIFACKAREPNKAMVSFKFFGMGKIGPLTTGQPPKLTENFSDLLTQAAAGVDCICLIMLGNQHQILGLLRHQPPLDVVTRFDPSLPIVDGSILVPEAAISELFASRYSALQLVLALLRSSFPEKTVIVLGPPPPIEDNHLIAQRLEPTFRGKLLAAGMKADATAIAEPLVRWKLWRILNATIESHARASDAIWLPVPAEVLDKGRFLKMEYLGTDATHANGFYGELRLQQMEMILR